MTTTTNTITTTTTTTFHSIFISKYIRHLIFNYIGDISNRLYKGTTTYDTGRQQRSLVGRDIINLPNLEMISHFAMPWQFVCHYLPTAYNDISEIPLNKRKGVISQYCFHPNATFDTLLHLLDWSPGIDFDWRYLEMAFDSRDIKNQEILEYIINRCPIDNRYILNDLSIRAFENGNLPIIKLIHSTKGVKLDGEPMETASREGFIDIVKYLHENIVKECTTDAMDLAASNGHLKVVKFLHFNRSEGCTKDALSMSAKYGYIDIVQFLVEHRKEGNIKEAMEYAFNRGHKDIYKFLQSVSE
ncbi:hypothetical protein DFA_04293 [Cavenderia fasciculata]|uniref:Ankyrin repeat-containing protein n=1 Tax=Cavenderia fasciculata TaxID=261658 RepID=F4PP62_CACFS|nr:uncharacterized protein DFA_04293 [Cavenderia fasciculata]EGG22175.1 hypothetical protein DFA_04293 [Cavenderia fasciculata]|eukprot:XP_004360026.1 hypothetical protein DFA_04293 [Cavenderia fasciculata]